jgi:transcriptional regulator with XRE-family HTH domain
VNTSPIAKRLKKARIAKKISQKQLGILVGIDPSTASSRMNHYECNRHIPNFKLVLEISKILNVPTPYFYCDDDDIADLLINIKCRNKVKTYELIEKIFITE